MAQVETDGAESWMETETEDCETKDEDEDLGYDCETEDEDVDLRYDYWSDHSDDTSDGEREYWMSITPVPGYVWTDLGIQGMELEEAVQHRYLDEAANKLSYLEALRSNGWSQLNSMYKRDLESEICNGSLVLSVIRGDRHTFTQKINELKEFYLTSNRPFPYPKQFTLMRLNLVKLLLDDDDAGFDAAIDFLVKTHSNFFWEEPIFFRFFTVRDVVNFLGANISMEGSESSSVEAVILGDIIDRCENNLPAYIQKNGLEWEVREFLESARDKWKKKTGFLICSCQKGKTGYLFCSCKKGPLEDLSRKQLIYEALAYLWFLLEENTKIGDRRDV